MFRLFVSSVLLFVMSVSSVWAVDYRRVISSQEVNKTEDFVEFTFTLSDGLQILAGFVPNEQSQTIIEKVQELLPVGKEMFLDAASASAIEIEYMLHDSFCYHGDELDSVQWCLKESSCAQLPQIVSMNIVERGPATNAGWQSSATLDVNFTLSDGSSWSRVGDVELREWRVGDHILVSPNTYHDGFRIFNVDRWNSSAYSS